MMQPAVRTLGGWPAAVSRAATSALMQLISTQPPTVEPGAFDLWLAPDAQSGPHTRFRLVR